MLTSPASNYGGLRESPPPAFAVVLRLLKAVSGSSVEDRVMSVRLDRCPGPRVVSVLNGFGKSVQRREALKSPSSALVAAVHRGLGRGSENRVPPRGDQGLSANDPSLGSKAATNGTDRSSAAGWNVFRKLSAAA